MTAAPQRLGNRRAAESDNRSGADGAGVDELARESLLKDKALADLAASDEAHAQQITALSHRATVEIDRLRASLAAMTERQALADADVKELKECYSLREFIHV